MKSKLFIISLLGLSFFVITSAQAITKKVVTPIKPVKVVKKTPKELAKESLAFTENALGKISFFDNYEKIDSYYSVYFKKDLVASSTLITIGLLNNSRSLLSYDSLIESGQCNDQAKASIYNDPNLIFIEPEVFSLNFGRTKENLLADPDSYCVVREFGKYNLKDKKLIEAKKYLTISTLEEYQTAINPYSNPKIKFNSIATSPQLMTLWIGKEKAKTLLETPLKKSILYWRAPAEGEISCYAALYTPVDSSPIQIDPRFNPTNNQDKVTFEAPSISCANNNLTLSPKETNLAYIDVQATSVGGGQIESLVITSTKQDINLMSLLGYKFRDEIILNPTITNKKTNSMEIKKIISNYFLPDEKSLTFSLITATPKYKKGTYKLDLASQKITKLK